MGGWSVCGTDTQTARSQRESMIADQTCGYGEWCMETPPTTALTLYLSRLRIRNIDSQPPNAAGDQGVIVYTDCNFLS